MEGPTQTARGLADFLAELMAIHCIKLTAEELTNLNELLCPLTRVCCGNCFTIVPETDIHFCPNDAHHGCQSCCSPAEFDEACHCRDDGYTGCGHEPYDVLVDAGVV